MEKIGVVGCGLMGAGIAEVCARAGLDVVVVESERRRGRRRPRPAGEVAAAGRGARQAGERRRRSSAGSRVVEDLDALADRELVVEAIVEDEAAKTDLFRQLDKSSSRPTRSSRPTPRRSRS